MDRIVTDLLHVKYDGEDGYYVSLWDMAISKIYKSADEAENALYNNKKDRTDMLITAMYGIASMLIAENNLKNKEKWVSEKQ